MSPFEQLYFSDENSLNDIDFDTFYETDIPSSLLEAPSVSALLLKRRTAIGMLVVMPAAQGNSARRRQVYFQLWKHADKFPNLHILCLSDPVMKLPGDRFMSYGIHSDFDSIPLFAEVVNTVALQFDVANESICFYGISQGGFLAMQTACLVEGSSAFVQVAPLSVLDSAQNAQLEAIKAEALNGISWHDFNSQYPERVSVLERIKKTNIQPRIHILTNRRDFTHQLALEFFSSVAAISDSLNFIGEISFTCHPSILGHSSVTIDELSVRIKDFMNGFSSAGIGNKSPLLGAKSIVSVHPPSDDIKRRLKDVTSENPLTLNDTLQWVSLPEDASNFEIILHVSGSPHESKQGILLSFSLHGATHSDKEEINLHYSDNSRIRWFRYVPTELFFSTQRIKVSLPPHCTIDAVGLRKWAFSDSKIYVDSVDFDLIS